MLSLPTHGKLSIVKMSILPKQSEESGNSHQNPSNILGRNIKIIPKIYLEFQGTLSS